MSVRECEECGDDVNYRRYRCPHINCNMLVCGACYTHVHTCWPDHNPAECWDRHPELRPATLHYHAEFLDDAHEHAKMPHCLETDCKRPNRYEVQTLEAWKGRAAA